MVETRIGKRYAKAIISLAIELGKVDEVYEDFLLFQDVCDNSREFVLMLQSPLIGFDVKQKIIDKIFSGKISETTEKYIRLIVRKHREQFLPNVADAYIELYYLHQNWTNAYLVSSHPVPQADKDKMVEIMETSLNTKIILHESIEKELIGGFKLTVGDKQFDATILTALNKLKRNFDNGTHIL